MASKDYPTSPLQPQPSFKEWPPAVIKSPAPLPNTAPTKKGP